MYETGYYSTGYYATGYYSRRAQEATPTLRYTWEGIIAEARYILQDRGLVGLVGSEETIVTPGEPGTPGTMYAVGIDSDNPGIPVLLRSTDGSVSNWELLPTGIDTGLFQYVLRDIDYAPGLGDGDGRLLAVGSFSRNIYSDDEGATWTYYTMNTNVGNMNCVAWSATLGLFAAGSAAGRIVTSPDGITWTQRKNVGVPINDIRWDDSAGQFVAVNSNASQGIIDISSDGITWTQPSDDDLDGLFLPNGSNVVLVADGKYVAISGNGAITPRHVYSDTPTVDNSWTRVEGNPNAFYDADYSPTANLWMGTLVANNANFATSSDITGLFSNVANNNSDGGNWRTVRYSAVNDKFVFLGSGTAGSNIMTTSDGVNFTIEEQPSMVPHIWYRLRELPFGGGAGGGETVITTTPILSPERYRWTDDSLVDNLNRGIEELKRVRPDAYYTLFGIYDGYTPEVVQTGAGAGQVNWNADFLLEKHFYSALVHYVVSQAFMEEDTNTGQANEHLQLFRKFALAT